MNPVQVVFATPTVNHAFSPHYLRAMQETQWLLGANHIMSAVMVLGGDCFVQKARNKLVTDFFRDFPDTENFFFLDDDIGWEAQKVLEFLRRPDDVVAGVYPKKSADLDFPVSLVAHPETGELIESQGLFQAVMVPTGFLRIKRHVLEMLARQSTTFFDMTPGGTYQEYHNIFEAGPGDDRKFWGEDYTFCRKLHDCGVPIWVDPHITFKHQGVWTWENRMADHLPTFRDRAVKMRQGLIDPDTGKEIMREAAE